MRSSMEQQQACGAGYVRWMLYNLGRAGHGQVLREGAGPFWPSPIASQECGSWVDGKEFLPSDLQHQKCVPWVVTADFRTLLS